MPLSAPICPLLHAAPNVTLKSLQHKVNKTDLVNQSFNSKRSDQQVYTYITRRQGSSKWLRGRFSACTDYSRKRPSVFSIR